jgi:hypothetical protein
MGERERSRKVRNVKKMEMCVGLAVWGDEMVNLETHLVIVLEFLRANHCHERLLVRTVPGQTCLATRNQYKICLPNTCTMVRRSILSATSTFARLT